MHKGGRRSGREGETVKVPSIELLHETSVLITGKEPFVNFSHAGLIVNLKDYSGASHNFVERMGSAGIPLNGLKAGDRLLFGLYRVTTQDLTLWDRVKAAFRVLKGEQQ